MCLTTTLNVQEYTQDGLLLEFWDLVNGNMIYGRKMFSSLTKSSLRVLLGKNKY